MKKIVILLVIALLAYGAIAAVLAYSGATVTCPAEIKIVTTDEALLALMASKDGAGVKYCFINGGTLNLGFTNPGFTPDSIYEFDELFLVKNNSADSIRFTIENVDVTYIKSIEPGAGCLQPGESAGITVCFDTNDAVAGSTIEGSLRVRAEAD